MIQKKDDKRLGNDAITLAAEELYGDKMYMTSAEVPRSMKDAVSPPSTQNEADSREWCLAHET